MKKNGRILFDRRSVNICSFFFVIFSILFYSCKKDEPVTIDTGKNYLPGTVGQFIIYEVDSTVYDDFSNDTVEYRFLLKEKIASVFADNEGRPALRIERFVKMYNDTISYDSLQWVLKDVWSANVTETTFEKVEENVRFVKLIFPVREDQEWNGNAYNTLGSLDYEYVSVDEPLMLSGISFDSTLTVLQNDVNNLIERKYYKEKYARNVGMIYKEIIDVYDTTTVPGVPVVNRIKGGVKYYMTVLSYGIE